MTLALAFAIIMLVWLVFGFLNYRTPAGYWPAASNLIVFILFLLLGWQVFGPLLHR